MDNEEQIPPEFQKPPKTIPEMGIHLFYMSKAMGEMKVMLGKLSSTYVCKVDLADAIKDRHEEQEVIEKRIDGVDKRLTAIEDTYDKFRNKIVIYAFTALALMILAQWGLEKFFKQ